MEKKIKINIFHKYLVGGIEKYDGYIYNFFFGKNGYTNMWIHILCVINTTLTFLDFKNVRLITWHRK